MSRRTPPLPRCGKALLLYLVLGLAHMACAEQPSVDTQGAAGTAGSTNPPLAGASGNGSPTTAKFSFFLISYDAIQALSGSAQGFGGDLRYGESGAGAGLRGADKICTAVAERSLAGNGKTWRAFLSTSTGDAIDRIGEGPWYDFYGRVLALTKDDLLATRPTTAHIDIKYDLPNEYGVPNRAPDGTLVDNHDILTGSGIDGRLYGPDSTCSDWTSSARDNSKRPRVGHSWPRGNVPPGNVEGMAHWISALDESGCGAGVNLNDNGNPGTDGNVGSGGGYGGFYCFALTP